MPSPVRITREDLIEAGVSLIREESRAAFSARNIAKRLSCSTQPIFSNFSSMEEFEQAVVDRVFEIYWKRTSESLLRTDIPPYKASGIAYIDFAIEEPNLFSLLFMRDRKSTDEAEEREIGSIIEIIMKNVGISREEALLFHGEMWVFTHGIAAMAATGYLRWSREIISLMLTDNYNGLVHVFRERSQNHADDRTQVTDKKV